MTATYAVVDRYTTTDRAVVVSVDVDLARADRVTTRELAAALAAKGGRRLSPERPTRELIRT